MTAQKIKRGGKSARRAAVAQGRGRQVRAAKAHTGSVLDSVMAVQPFSESQLHHIFLAAILGALALLAWVVASYAGLPLMVREQVAIIAHEAGFEVHNIEVRGTNHLNQLQVYQIALADRDRAMPFVDVEDLRSRLLGLSWVGDARVSRQLPDTVVIDIVERKPIAVVERPDRMALIDPTGRELEVVGAGDAKGKLLLKGAGVEQQVTALTALLDAAPALRPQLAGAEWVGNRRWNLTFKTGQVLALPEGADQAARALVKFAQIDGRNRLLGGKATAFDLRAPDRMYIRVPGRSETPAQPAAPASTAATPLAEATAAAKPKAKPAAKEAQ